MAYQHAKRLLSYQLRRWVHIANKAAMMGYFLNPGDRGWDCLEEDAYHQELDREDRPLLSISYNNSKNNNTGKKLKQRSNI